jgi:membrane-bound lytic murein transglycosylase D
MKSPEWFGRWVMIAALLTLLSGCQSLPHSRTVVADGGVGHAVDDAWGALRRGFSLPDLEGDAAAEVDRQIHALIRARLLEGSAARACEQLPLYIDAVAQRGLPMELVLVPFVESGLDAMARSPKGAHGAWQFMPATARDRGLVVNHLIDQRRDWLLSTQAALDHLQRLHRLFEGDWHLALAAYNCGEGCVGRAQRRAGAEGRPARFEQLELPLETRRYVARIEALRRLVSEPGRYGVRLPDVPMRNGLMVVDLQRDLDFARAVAWSGLEVESFVRLNPAVQSPLIVVAWTPQLVLPAAAAQRFLRQQASALDFADADTGRVMQHLQPERQRITVTVRRGDTLIALARRLGVRPVELAQWNGLGPQARLREGGVLVAYVRRGAEVT